MVERAQRGAESAVPERISGLRAEVYRGEGTRAGEG